jgi:hypothetical protein
MNRGLIGFPYPTGRQVTNAGTASPGQSTLPGNGTMKSSILVFDSRPGTHTWLVPQGVYKIRSASVGAGGLGTSSAPGSSGGYEEIILNVLPGQSLVYVNGAGGTLSTPNGGTSSFAGLISATGGQTAGGSPGVGSGGSVSSSGAAGTGSNGGPSSGNRFGNGFSSTGTGGSGWGGGSASSVGGNGGIDGFGLGFLPGLGGALNTPGGYGAGGGSGAPGGYGAGSGSGGGGGGGGAGLIGSSGANGGNGGTIIEVIG